MDFYIVRCTFVSQKQGQNVRQQLRTYNVIHNHFGTRKRSKIPTGTSNELEISGERYRLIIIIADAQVS